MYKKNAEKDRRMNENEIIRAENLAGVYNNFSVSPLRTEEEFEKFYVSRLTPSIESMKERIESSQKDERYIFMGFRGSGKSTELYRLMNLLNKEKFYPVFFDVFEFLDMNDFDYREFFASIALYLNDSVLSLIDMKREIREDFEEFMMDITKIEESEVLKEKGLGFTLEKFIVAKLGSEAKTRNITRKNLENRITDLMVKLNNLVIEIENELEKKIVIIVDGLDKLSRFKQAEDFFYNNYRLLTQIDCHVIYTFPIDLAYSPRFQIIRHAFDEDMVLPQPPVRTKQLDRIYEKGFEFYKRIAEKRINLDLIEEKALREAIVSTGKLTEFMLTIREAAIRSSSLRKDIIGLDEILFSLEKLRRTYDRTLTVEELKRLVEIHNKKQARDIGIGDSVVRNLLFSLTAVEYESEEEGKWCEVNPLLFPLIEELKERA